jgi:hypothetical protein
MLQGYHKMAWLNIPWKGERKNKGEIAMYFVLGKIGEPANHGQILTSAVN